MPDGRRISEPRSVELAGRGWCQRLRLKGQARNVEVLSHKPSDTAKSQSRENTDDPANHGAVR